MKQFLPPQNKKELIQRATGLAGCTFEELAKICDFSLPTNTLHSKGWLGQLLEYFLGAQSGCLSQPDFIHLGIELKTIPLTEKGLPKESTYICTTQIPITNRHWKNSNVYKKMACILWVPYFAKPPIPKRTLCAPILWTMDSETEKTLKQDWEELTEKISLGQFADLSSHLGQYLQIRPKAANSKTFIQVLNHQGKKISIVPKGFYLRTTLTKNIINQHFIHL